MGQRRFFVLSCSLLMASAAVWGCKPPSFGVVATAPAAATAPASSPTPAGVAVTTYVDPSATSAFAGADDTDLIAVGAGGSVGVGTGGVGVGESGKLAPYGIRGGGSGAGPKGMFGHGTMNASRIVYVLDHSGSTIDTFDFLREEVKNSLAGLTPMQAFSVIMFSEKVDEVFPKDGAHLVNATPDVKRELKDFVDNVRAAGKNDDLYDPFADGLRRAFAMRPQVIYFLTDGNFDPRVVDEAKRLNTIKCKINTIAFIKVSKEAEKALQTIAADSNGGKFKFVTEKDLGK